MTEAVSLYDYGNQSPPRVALRQCVRHPENWSTVIGHVAYDERRDEMAALFPREREDHYFRKFNGYALSEEVLQDVRARGVETIYIIEQDNDHQFIEFDPTTFYSSSYCVAYSSELDTTVEGEDALAAADEETFSDRQRIAPEVEARKTWEREVCGVSES